MARMTSQIEINRALAGKKLYIVKRRDKDGVVSRWPIISDSKEKVIPYVKGEDIDTCTHEIESVYTTPIIIL